MVELWYGLLSITLVLFAVLDGWNIGAGAVHFVIGRSAGERRALMAALGPLWSWHEVWLIAAGGTLLLAFPAVLAAAFSGFYLALWMVLWGLMLRGIAIEVAGHIGDGLWQSAWDAIFAAASLLLAVLFGAAFGNVLRGVPLDASGAFGMALFTDFGVRGQVGILDWYTLSVAVFTVLALAAHGATYLGVTAPPPLAARSVSLARRLWMAALPAFVGVSIATASVRPELFDGLRRRPLAWLAVAAVAAGAWAIATGLRRASPVRALAGSSAVLAGIVGAAAVSLFPVMLHSTLDQARSITAYQAATAGRSLALALWWWPLAFVLAFAYAALVLRRYGVAAAPAPGAGAPAAADDLHA